MQKISIELGSQLIVDFGKAGNRVKCELIGLKTGRYLIIGVDDTNASLSLHNTIFKGNQITARYIHKGVVYGFQSSISYITFNPEKLIFIAYPNKVEEKSVRKLQRVDCNFPAKTMFSSEVYDGIIIDISKEGCKFSLVFDDEAGRNKLNDFLSKFMGMSVLIKLNLQLPGDPHVLSIDCKIKSIKQSEQHFYLGLEFNKMSDEDSIILHDYLTKIDALPKIFNLAIAKTKHSVWVNKIKSSLNANKDIDISDLLSSRDCDLGRWLYSEGLARYSSHSDMPKLEKTHDKLHNLIKDIGKTTPNLAKQKQSLITNIDTIITEFNGLLNNIEQHINIK